MSHAPAFALAKWIRSPLCGGPKTPAAAPHLRFDFVLEKVPTHAELTATALGLYECEINGHRVGNEVFAPGWTDYGKRVHCQSFDVRALLRRGENAIGAILGDGWYCGHVAWGDRQTYGDRPAFRACLELTFADGTRQTIVTGPDWTAMPGPILANDLLLGEHYDARCELPNWSTANAQASHWLPVLSGELDGIAIHPSPAPPIRRIQERAPVTVRDISVSRWPGLGRLFDFGQNFSGRIRLRVRAARGITITLRHGETLDANGNLYTANLDKAAATDYYTCKGDHWETWEPRFTFHGFRHVEISGYHSTHSVEATGIVLHSDMESTGEFSCSHPLISRLQENIRWGQKSNFLDVPTDCPNRSERLGWTGDVQVFVPTACFNYNVHGFFEKWMRDVRDAQRPDGSIPRVIPNTVNCDEGGPGWCDAVVVCPWTVYQTYGDKKILADNYDAMVRFLNHLKKHRCRDHIRSHPDVDPWGGFGDWMALDGNDNFTGATPKDLIATAFYAEVTRIVSRIAALLGKKKDAAGFRALHSRITAAFRQRFLTPAGLLVADTQTAYVLALKFDLLPTAQRQSAARQLIRLLEKRSWHLSTGFVGTPYLLEVLANHGQLDAAYRLLEQETNPSWLAQVKNGATTIWERWDGWTPEKGFQDPSSNSFNHYAYGSVGAWLYQSVAGLASEAPGYRKVRFCPRPGGSLTWAKASLKTEAGRIAIQWKIRNRKLTVDLEVPAGCAARFEPPVGWEGKTSFIPVGQTRLELRAR